MDVFQEAEMLRRVPFFGGLDSAKLKLLAFTSRALKFAPGEDLVKKGGVSDSAYVILDGEAEVIGETSGGEFVIAALGSNALIGEMGIIRNVPRGLTVRAKTPVRALRIASEIFLGLINLFFTGQGLYFWAVGFGILHIAYGIFMWWKYERN